MEATKKLNFSPNKHGVSKHYSPRMIVDRINIDYERDCKYALGDNVQDIEESDPSYTTRARSLDCLYLRPAAQSQNGHELLYLICLTEVLFVPGFIRNVISLSKIVSNGVTVELHDGFVTFKTGDK
jgi:hypothetical protein